MTLTTLYEIGGVLVGAGILGGFGRWAWHHVHPWFVHVGDFLEDWRGVPDRPGVPGRLGMMPRMKSVEDGLSEIRAEISPNSGKSMRDAVHRTEAAVDGIGRHVAILRADVDTLKADRVRFHGAD